MFLISNKTNRFLSHKIRTPNFVHLQGLDFMFKHHMLANVVIMTDIQDILLESWINRALCKSQSLSSQKIGFLQNSERQ